MWQKLLNHLQDSLRTLGRRIFLVVGYISMWVVPGGFIIDRYVKFYLTLDYDIHPVGFIFIGGFLVAIYILVSRLLSKLKSSLIKILLRYFQVIMPLAAIYYMFYIIETMLLNAAWNVKWIIYMISFGFLMHMIDWILNKKEILYRQKLKKAKEIAEMNKLVKDLESGPIDLSNQPWKTSKKTTQTKARM